MWEEITLNSKHKITSLSFTLFLTSWCGLATFKRRGHRKVLTVFSSWSSVSAEATRRNTLSSSSRKTKMLLIHSLFGSLFFSPRSMINYVVRTLIFRLPSSSFALAAILCSVKAWLSRAKQLTQYDCVRWIPVKFFAVRAQFSADFSPQVAFARAGVVFSFRNRSSDTSTVFHNKKWF